MTETKRELYVDSLPAGMSMLEVNAEHLSLILRVAMAANDMGWKGERVLSLTRLPAPGDKPWNFGIRINGETGWKEPQ